MKNTTITNKNKDLLWEVKNNLSDEVDGKKIFRTILRSRGLKTDAEIGSFINPRDPLDIPIKDAGIEKETVDKAVFRIAQAIKNQESIIVYADYDADGITAGAVMWEAIHKLGGKVMPYIPHRVNEGYGLSKAGIDSVKADYDARLIVTVDHGITGRDKVEYARSLGIETIITDHHAKPDLLPVADIIHTTSLSGSGVAWFLARELEKKVTGVNSLAFDLLPVAVIGTIADLVPLIGVNRAFVKKGLELMSRSRRAGLNALFSEAGIAPETVDVYAVSHMIAPRLNAMGRLTHALDALRLLCTGDGKKALLLAKHLGDTNRDRQQLTLDTTAHAAANLKVTPERKIIVTGHRDYNQGIIGLVAGKLTEAWYRPAIVLSLGEELSKASARSIAGFNIIEVLRELSDLLEEVGGHPMAAGFSVKTANLAELTIKLEKIAAARITEDMLTRRLPIDVAVPLSVVDEDLWLDIQKLAPFGMANYDPVLASFGVEPVDIRPVGQDGKHLKLKVKGEGAVIFDAIAFGMGGKIKDILNKDKLDIAYTVDMNEWNGRKSLQLILKDIR
jgi:single-stranded-DNA-specific exonuclease